MIIPSRRSRQFTDPHMVTLSAKGLFDDALAARPSERSPRERLQGHLLDRGLEVLGPLPRAIWNHQQCAGVPGTERSRSVDVAARPRQYSAGARFEMLDGRVTSPGTSRTRELPGDSPVQSGNLFRLALPIVAERVACRLTANAGAANIVATLFEPCVESGTSGARGPTRTPTPGPQDQ